MSLQPRESQIKWMPSSPHLMLFYDGNFNWSFFSGLQALTQTLTWVIFAKEKFLLLIFVGISPWQAINVLLARPIQMPQQSLFASCMSLLMPRVEPVVIRPVRSIRKFHISRSLTWAGEGGRQRRQMPPIILLPKDNYLGYWVEEDQIKNWGYSG
jgi:hypothetical protein